MIEIKGSDGASVWVRPSAINAILIVSAILNPDGKCVVILAGANVPVTRTEADRVLNIVLDAEAPK